MYCPPELSMRLADQVLLVVRAGLTSQEMVRKAVKQLSTDAVGVVLAAVEMGLAPSLMYQRHYAGKNGRNDG